MKGFKITLFFLLFSFCLAAQSIVGLKDWQLRDLIKRSEIENDIYTQLDAYKELDKRALLLNLDYIHMADLYYQVNDFENALELYDYLKDELPDDPEVYFRYAMCHKRLGMLESAYIYLERFPRLFKKENSALKEYMPKVEFEMKGCEIGTDPSLDKEMDIYRLPDKINLPHNEAAPHYIESKGILTYSSVRTAQYTFDKPELIPYREILKAEFSNSIGDWEYSGKVNALDEAKTNYDNFFYSEALNKSFYTACSTKRKKRVCKIYQAEGIAFNELQGTELDLGVDYDFYSISQATVAKFEDDYYLLFSADIDGGFGGKDIWMKSLGKDKEVQNLGAKINTSGDEETPWYDDKRSQLFFSSNGHAGMGGMDIYKSNGTGTKWTEVENVGRPINSTHDDVYYSHVYEEDSLVFGFFASTRPGGESLNNPSCCSDIFEFRPRENNEILVEGEVALTDLASGRPKGYTGNVDLGLYQVDSDDLVFVKDIDADENGRFKTIVEKGKKYVVKSKKDGYLDNSISFEAGNNEKLQLDLKELTKEPIVVKNIYYPFDEDYLTADSKTVIDTTIFKILSDNPSIIIELSSHTDWFGTDEYNEDLSQRRAESVVDYLISKGIKEERLKPKGYGEYRPLVPNSNPDGSDNPENRAKNRRTEFKIIGVLPQYDKIIYKQ